MAAPRLSRTYKPEGRVLRDFLLSSAFVQCVQGPWGSGKSTATAVKLWMIACRQQPAPDGIRRTRHIIVRNTFPDLENTTVKTWLSLFPENEFGRFYRSKPFTHPIRVGDVEAEFIFLALDDEDDVKKLLSLEATTFWVNEAREVPKALIDAMTGRAGRYPRMLDGGPTWFGVLMDTNAPSEDHWIPIMRRDVPPPEWMTQEEREALVKPDNWEFFVQPGGLKEIVDKDGNHVRYEANPEAENTRWLPPGYYENLVKGKTRSWVAVNVLNKLGRIQAGKPVWPMYVEETHLAREPIRPADGVPLLVGVDFGRQPAAVIGQCVHGRWLILHELIGRDMGATTFAPLLKRELAQKFPGYKFALYGDPSGDFKGQSDERTPFQIFRTAGLPILPAPSNDISVRIQAVEQVLNRLVDGKPAFLLSPTCTTLKSAMAGGYHYRRLKVSGAERYADQPEKDRWSHIGDSLQYLVLGGGEGRILLTGSSERPKPTNARKPYSPFKAAGGLRKW